MIKILNVKSWVSKEKRQFIRDEEDSFFVIRIKDNITFACDGSYLSKIYFENRIGHIIDYMTDMIHVSIEVKKENVVDFPGMEFDPENYVFIEVPINNIEPRKRITKWPK